MKINSTNTKQLIGKLLILFLIVGSGIASEDASQLFEERSKLQQTVWEQEMAAQEYESFFIELWDSLRNDGDAMLSFQNAKFGSIKFGNLVHEGTMDHGIEVFHMSEEYSSKTYAEWMEWLNALREEGFEFYQSEWHHKRFGYNEDGTGKSKVSFSLHVENAGLKKRYQLDGMLDVVWQPAQNAAGIYEPELIKVSSLSFLERQGPPLFVKLGAFDIAPKKRGPILVYDLNGDGRSEIVLAGASQIAWNRGKGSFALAPLSKHPVFNSRAAVLGDFDRDGTTDLMVDGSFVDVDSKTKEVGLFIYKGSGVGDFPSKPQLLKIDPYFEVKSDTTLTAGDIDNDGDLDLWLGQYKEPYRGGSMPTPFFDSNDGHPSYLLFNEGDGIHFAEKTEVSGIKEKRHRRVYSSSFYDYDNDLDQDLLVICDFAGIDLYQNQGDGTFTDVTSGTIKDGFLFGMAHSFADFNYDGLIDFYSIGMSSTTASRLHAMGAGRKEFDYLDAKRIPMTYGNRLYLAGEDGKFTQPQFNDKVARTGWSWGVVTTDLDNDGDIDFYVANGHDSNTTCRDYCTSYWTDDIYHKSSIENPLMEDYFGAKIDEKEDKGISWNGFEHNFFFMPMSDGKIRNISFLAGLALEHDSRMVIADDLNGDGRLDLIIDSNPPDWDGETDGNTATVFLNNFEHAGNYIGVRLQDKAGAPLATNARVVVSFDGKLSATNMSNGDSFESQHPLSKHFGIGQTDSVDFIEVTWTDGTTKRIENPEINQYHLIEADQ